jgi:hypothetical protein
MEENIRLQLSISLDFKSQLHGKSKKNVDCYIVLLKAARLSTQ